MASKELALALASIDKSHPPRDHMTCVPLIAEWRALAREFMDEQEAIWEERGQSLAKFHKRRTYFQRGARLAWINEHLEAAHLPVVRSTKELEYNHIVIFWRWLVGHNPYHERDTEEDQMAAQFDRWDEIKDWLWWQEEDVVPWQEESRQRAKEYREERKREAERIA